MTVGALASPATPRRSVSWRPSPYQVEVNSNVQEQSEELSQLTSNIAQSELVDVKVNFVS